MSHSVGTRVEVLGVLTCLGPVHVGGWDTTVEADLAIARDGTGAPVVPGTSIAGALRAYLAGINRFRAHCDAMFGHIVPRTQNGSPSWIRIDDAHLIDDEVIPLVRDGVGIDRRSRSAAQGFLYTQQVLPAGTRFAFRLVADTPSGTATRVGTTPAYPGGWAALVHDTVEAAVAGLAHARVPIGAGRGHGLGRVTLDEIAIRRCDLSTPDGLITWLTGTTPTVTGQGQQTEPPPDGHLKIIIDWRPAGPVLVKDSLPGTVVDILPLTDTHADGTVWLLLPGSSIRGAIRAHAERIVRTLRGHDAPPDFGDALRSPPLGVDVLFGTAPARSRRHPTAETNADDGGDHGVGRGRRGVLSVADCHSTHSVTAAAWNSIVTVRPDIVPSSGEEREDREQRNKERATALSSLRDRLEAINASFGLRVSDHVAVDRWTGGSGDHRLFSALEPDSSVAWDPIEINVDIARLRHQRAGDATSPDQLALPLLLLTLRDLRDGWLSLGYGGTRGRGHIEVAGIEFTGAGLGAGWQSLAGRSLDDILTHPPDEIAEAMVEWARTFDVGAA